MSAIKFSHKLIGGSVLFAALFAGYFGYRGYESAPIATQVKRSALHPAAQSKPLASPVPEVSPSLLARLSTRGQPNIPSEVQKLLPSITAAVANWKEFKPKSITIAPYPDTPIEFQVSSVREENGRTLWTGRNALQGAFLTAASTENEWQATLVIPPVGAFDIRISGQNVTVLERNAVDETCGAQVALGRDLAPLDTTVTTNASPVAAADTVSVVDVLYFYDADTLAKVGSQSAFETRVMLNIESANAALVNSQVTNFRWRFVASYQVPTYATTNDMEDDLNTISGYLNGKAVTNPVYTFVHGKAVLHGADQVVLYVGGSRNDAGIAWISSGTSPRTLGLDFHSGVVAWNTSFSVMAHELAHNFGCHHDRETENASDGDGHFYYGHRFRDTSNQDTGTIMSYANFRLPYYSNPSLTVNGYVLGVADDQPRAADNARVLREAAVAMSDSRVSVDGPAITTQPQSVTVTIGQSFSLSVVATGANLSYQWKVGGVDIPGATSASYSKTGSTTSDSGAYTVVVSNVIGSITSNSATVTVNTIATPTPATPVASAPAASAPAATSSGGGGGGSIDATFATLGALAFLLRWRLHSRR